MAGRFGGEHGGAVTLAHKYREEGLQTDLLATDMLDLATFSGPDARPDPPTALHARTAHRPPPGEKHDLHYGFINYASMLCADRVLFNSAYHLESWFEELPRLLKHFPDYTELHTVASLRGAARCCRWACHWRRLDAHRGRRTRRPLLIVWNHRWYTTRRREVFFRALYALAERGLDFRLALLGESVQPPLEFEEARERLAGHLVQYGYAESFAEYVGWLWRGDGRQHGAIQESFEHLRGRGDVLRLLP